MKRRAVAAAALALVIATALGAVAAPAKACPKITDAQGDARPEPEDGVAVPQLADQALDISSVTFKPAGKGLAVAMTVAKFAERPAYAVGGRYQAQFMMDGRLIEIYYKIGPARAVESNAFYQSGIREDGSFISESVTATVSGNTITLAVSATDLKTALGPKAVGSKITGLAAIALGSYVATNFAWDQATAPASLSYVIGAACRA